MLVIGNNITNCLLNDVVFFVIKHLIKCARAIPTKPMQDIEERINNHPHGPQISSIKAFQNSILLSSFL